MMYIKIHKMKIDYIGSVLALHFIIAIEISAKSHLCITVSNYVSLLGYNLL